MGDCKTAEREGDDGVANCVATKDGLETVGLIPLGCPPRTVVVGVGVITLTGVPAL